ncbi:MAG: hypothetical protein AB4041_15975 [Microcystaceae cyanobacterium]
MSQYPLILLPNLLTDVTPPTHSKPIKPSHPILPRKPNPLPLAPQPINIQRLIIYSLMATAISLTLGGIISVFNPSVGGGLGIFLLLASLGVIFLQTLGEKSSFNRRLRQYEDLQNSYLHQFESYSQQLARYEQAQQTYPTALQAYQDSLHLWQQDIEQFRAVLSDTLNQAQSYQTVEIKQKKSSAEQRFEAVLNKYFPSRIKTILKVEASNNEQRFNYMLDFVYIDEDINLYIDIEIDEPYEHKTRELTHYLGSEDEPIRHHFFLEIFWIIIRFSEEQVVRNPPSCCKVIAQVIKQITGDDTTLSPLQNEPDLSPTKRWNYEEATIMEQQDYRKTYLQQ